MTLEELESKDHRSMLDVVDKLRSLGISRYVDLPQIIVCGDQSAGKSSVLEAISGMNFPSKDKFCTRFATELVLRRDDMVAVKTTIIPGDSGPKRTSKRRKKFAPKIDAENLDLGSVIEHAQEVMGFADSGGISRDTLRVELSGPN
jgi:hypothetical protein